MQRRLQRGRLVIDDLHVLDRRLCAIDQLARGVVAVGAHVEVAVAAEVEQDHLAGRGWRQ